MSILTGLVIVVAMAVLAQKSDSLYKFFSREDVARIAPQNDESVLVAGGSQIIDVLANDENAAPGDGANLRIVVSPSCGAAEATPDGVLYISNERCVGPQLFAYCVAKGDECPSASVTVNVTAAGASGGTLVSEADQRVGGEQIALAPAPATAPRSAAPAGEIAQRPRNVPQPPPNPANVPATAPNVTDQTSAPRVAGASRSDDVTTAPANLPAVRSNGPVVAAINPVAPTYQPPIASGARDKPAANLGSDDGGTGENVVAALSNAAEPAVRSDGPRRPILLNGTEDAVAGQQDDRADLSNANSLSEIAAPRLDGSPDVSDIEVEPQVPVLPQTEIASLQPPAARPTVDRVEDEQIAAVRRDPAPATPRPRPRQTAGTGCGPVSLTSSASSGGASLIRIVSECRADEVFEVVHAGLRFGSRFDDAGSAELIVPVMDIEDGVSVRLLDGNEVAADLQFNRREVELTLRVAVAWTAPVDLDLHAFEYAAGFGADGHVWQERPRGFRLVRRGGGGYLDSYPALDADGQSIEVYTFWANSRARRGTARIAVDHASRGELPDGAFCGDGELASPSYEMVRSERGVLQSSTRGRFAAARCGQLLTSDVRYVSSALNDLRIE
ncbi:MAG: hypothetical protein AAF367_05430 [Pseudomonadota bacterium]